VKDATALLMSTLGVTRRAADDEFGLVQGTSVRLEWLRVNFSNVTDADMKVRIKCVVRAICFIWLSALYLVIKAEQEFMSHMLHSLRTWVLF